MKCNRKKAYFSLVPVVIVVATIVACAVLFYPEFKNAVTPTEPPFPSLCDGADCPDIQQSLAAAVSRTNCDSEECVLAAARIIQLMDRSVDPCENFFNFSCGNFHHQHVLPEGNNIFNSLGVYLEQLDLDIKSIIEEPNYGNDSESLLKTKQVYQSCMELERNEETSVKHLRDVLSNMGIGEWPLLDPEWKECRLDLEWRMAKLNAIGMSSLVRLSSTFSKELDYRTEAYMTIASPLIFHDCEEKYENATDIWMKGG
ncbi:membrane metallo-endopeptidase-like 1 [Caerostris extrusa]|uniref:Membrane metallo-endopeptidase-like 1 n=1 Tax=Caerostris extrusa TaxID=172846 RepID=A0AAV4VA07_CAEEX|nr:membrane metallo-endopeptidase-like 1 [Caerostris extrusa]